MVGEAIGGVVVKFRRRIPDDGIVWAEGNR